MVPPAVSAEGTEVEVDVLGTRYPATIIPESPFDLGNERLRG